MKKPALVTGIWVGLLTAILVITLLYAGDQLFRFPFVPFDFWNWQARVVPRNMLSLAAAGIGDILARIAGAPLAPWRKASELIVALLIFGGVMTLAGFVTAWGIRRTWRESDDEHHGWAVGALAGGVVFVLVALMELALGMQQVGAYLWYALLFVGWGAAMGALLEGRLIASLPAETDSERRRGLAQLAGGMIGGALVAWGIGAVAGQRAPTGADEPLTGGPGQPLGQPTEPAATEPPGTVTPETVTPGPTPGGGTAIADLNIPVGDDGRILPVPGTRPEVTPEGEFYRIDIAATPPRIDGATWRLVMAGLFARTPSLSLDELRAYPVHTQPVTMSCISNEVGGHLISSAYWTGLRLMDLTEDLGLSPDAAYLHIRSADGFYETVPLSDIQNPQTLLVYGMNDRSLPERHGYPLRIYIPNRYGMKQPKWIERIEATTEDMGGYWTDRGWSKQAFVNILSVIDVVAVDEAHDGLIPVGGVAWAGARGIQRVEVQVDEGDWVEAVLRSPALGPLTWVQWRYEWPSAPGRHVFSVRATDGNGDLQTPQRTGVLPSGATGYHTMRAEV